MKVIADVARCQGHARCADSCPEVFMTDEKLGQVIVRLPQVPKSLQAAAALAVNNCPEGALSIDEE